MVKLEKDIESAFVKYAFSKNCWPIKFSDPARKGAPDRLVLCPFQKLFWIEFKRGKKSIVSEHQKRYAADLALLGFPVYLCDNLKRAKEILNLYLLKQEDLFNGF
jgi:hypothetical protein